MQTSDHIYAIALNDFIKMDLEHLKPDEIDITKGHWWIENTYEDENDWHLTCSTKNEGGYAFEVCSMFSIIKALEHISKKRWVDEKRLLDGLMPAIRFFSYGHDKIKKEQQCRHYRTSKKK